jgi:hypothetical protein
MNRERESVHNVISPKANEIDTDAVIVVIPDVEFVPPERFLF